MTFLGKSLADGQLPTTQGALYTVPASTRAIIKTIDIVSKTATPQAVEVFIKRSGGTARSIGYVNPLEQYEKIEYLSDGNTITLSAGDAIEGITTTATAVDFSITGAEEAV